MMIAPHPDDESLAAGVLLQRGVAAGAAVRVIYATDGDDNPWPQRALEKRWRLAAEDRVRWGKRRRQEAIAALAKLSIAPTSARFLGLPDQGLTHALLHDARATALRLAALIKAWAPTHLLFPCELDTHPDHSALALLTRFALEAAHLTDQRCALFTYLVHGQRAQFTSHGIPLLQTAAEAATKRSAIAEHETQVKLSRRRFMAYASRPECYVPPSAAVSALGKNRRRAALRDAEQVRILFRFRLKSLGRARTHLYLVAHDRAGLPMTLSMHLPIRDASIQITDCASHHRRGLALFHGNALHGTITIPAAFFSPDQPIWAKITRRPNLFGGAGWEQIPALIHPTSKVSAAKHTVVRLTR